MDVMDYDVYLFIDVEMGEDVVVYWVGLLGLWLVCQYYVFFLGWLCCCVLVGLLVLLIVNLCLILVFMEVVVVDWVCEYGLLFLFFIDQVIGCGQLFYFCYDGNFGLIILIGDGVVDGLV